MYGPSTLLSVLSTIVTLWPCHVLGFKCANNPLTIAASLPYCYNFSTYPSEDNSQQVVVPEFFSSFLPPVKFLYLFILGKER